MFYLDGTELLRKLNKKNILKEIKKYAKQISENKNKISDIQSDIENTIILEHSLIEKINTKSLEKKEGKQNDKHKRR